MVMTNELVKQANQAIVYFDEPPFMPDDEPPSLTQAKPQKKRYKILSAVDFLKPQPPVEWIVDGLIPAGGLNIFYGESGCGKTWSLMDLEICVARGDNWLNLKTQKCNVLHIDEDGGEIRTSRRFSEVIRGHEADNNTPIYSVADTGFDFSKPNDIGELYNLIVEVQAQLVIIDTLADIMPGRDENSVKDVLPILKNIRRIAEETRAAIILIHHANRNGSYRGSSAIKGKLDALVCVEKPTGSDEIKFSVEKLRDGATSTFAATANFMTIDPKLFWLSTSTATASITFGKGQKYVFRYLLENGASEITAISSNADSCSPDTARRSVYSLADTGHVQRVDGGGAGVKAVYDLTDEGKEAAENV
jgi:DNA-binding HxlR family transcriptional regulator